MMDSVSGISSYTTTTRESYSQYEVNPSDYFVYGEHGQVVGMDFSKVSEDINEIPEINNYRDLRIALVATVEDAFVKETKKEEDKKTVETADKNLRQEEIKTSSDDIKFNFDDNFFSSLKIHNPELEYQQKDLKQDFANIIEKANKIMKSDDKAVLTTGKQEFFKKLNEFFSKANTFKNDSQIAENKEKSKPAISSNDDSYNPFFRSALETFNYGLEDTE